MKLLIDENLSPTLTSKAHEHGYDATAVRDHGALRRSDAGLLALCIDEERVMVSVNAGDFRALCDTAELHPGLIVLRSVPRARQREHLAAALAHVRRRAVEVGEVESGFMLNRVVEVDAAGNCTDASLPAGA